MTDEERYKKYIKEHCINCKNNKTDLCEIRISRIDKVIKTKCEYYEREKESIKRKKAIQYWQSF